MEFGEWSVELLLTADTFPLRIRTCQEIFTQNIKRKLSSTPHCPQTLFLFVSIKRRVSSTPHSSLHTPHCSDVCVFEVNVGDFVADRMIEEDFSDTAEIFYGITDIITADTFL